MVVAFIILRRTPPRAVIVIIYYLQRSLFAPFFIYRITCVGVCILVYTFHPAPHDDYLRSQ